MYEAEPPGCEEPLELWLTYTPDGIAARQGARPAPLEPQGYKPFYLRSAGTRCSPSGRSSSLREVQSGPGSPGPSSTRRSFLGGRGRRGAAPREETDYVARPGAGHSGVNGRRSRPSLPVASASMHS